MTAASPAKRFRDLGSKAVPYLLILPVVVYYILFWIRPVMKTIINSFRDAAGSLTFQPASHRSRSIISWRVRFSSIGGTSFFV